MNMESVSETRDPAMRKTAGFLGAGLLLLALGWAVQPRFKPATLKPAVERVLFPELTDAEKAASLEIIRYDDELATLYPFKVIKTGGVWVLPSHQNYPADAKDQLAAAATELVDLKALDVVTERAADHEVYGVIEPDQEKIKPGMTGVGQLIEIRDASGSKIARLIIGKEDKQAGVGSGSRRLRFVRKAGQDPVYRVELDTSKFTTQFGDWIEKDLLKLTPWDVRSVELDNYTLAAVESDGRLEVRQQRSEKMQLSYDDKASSWQLTSLETFPNEDSAESVSEELKNNEEVDSTKLNDLRNALGDLQIIDVARKPAGLSADLKAAESFVNDVEAVSSLQQRGFLPLPSGAILSTEGQTVIGMKDGVEYVLRFGAGTTVTEPGKAGSGEDGDASGESAETAARYLLVMAQFNESLLEKPELAELPSLPEEDDKDGDSTEQPKDEESEEEKAEEEASSDEKEPADADVTAADLLKQADEAEAAMQKAIEDRRQVERENRRKQESYDEKVVEGKKRVAELNGRFADWYYIVSDEEFEKIHLNREAVIKAKAESASDTAQGSTGPVPE
ncbi:MAG: hypothetical protein CMJ56_00215 [Planctomycetaceae bacterium]|nr:hypothetical protein [Planctomycetaceae bacterium]MCK4615424.1 DUF4340 domain-containing protein [Pirellulales bacterium]